MGINRLIYRLYKVSESIQQHPREFNICYQSVFSLFSLSSRIRPRRGTQSKLNQTARGDLCNAAPLIELPMQENSCVIPPVFQSSTPVYNDHKANHPSPDDSADMPSAKASHHEVVLSTESGEGLRRHQVGTEARPHGRMTPLPRKRSAPKVHRPDSQTHPPPVMLALKGTCRHEAH